MPMVREDEKGLFIISDCHIVRPFAYLKTSFKKGMRVRANHHEGTNMYSIRTTGIHKETWFGDELSPEAKRIIEQKDH